MATPTWIPTKREIFLTAIGKGATMRAACGIAGTSSETPYRWIKRGQSEPDSEYGEFYRLYLEARAVVELGMLDIMTTAARTDWRCAQAVLRALAPAKWGGRNERLERATARKAEAEADQAEALARRAHALAAHAATMSMVRAPTPDSHSAIDEENTAEVSAAYDGYALPAARFWEGPAVPWPDISAERVFLRWRSYRKNHWRGAVDPRGLCEAFKRVAAAHADIFHVAEDALDKLSPEVLWPRFERSLIARSAFVPCAAAGPAGTPHAPPSVGAPMPGVIGPVRSA